MAGGVVRLLDIARELGDLKQKLHLLTLATFIGFMPFRGRPGCQSAPDGGMWLPGVLVADTLDELRAMLPAGLTRHERTDVMSAAVVETWD